MGRRKNPNRKAIPTHIRVKMHRERKKLKQEREQLLNLHLNGSTSSRDAHSNQNNSSVLPDESFSLKSKLKEWVDSYRIATRAVNSLLAILNSVGIDSLPKNYRTLMGTPLDIEFSEIAGGQLWYNGLKKSLIHIFSTLDCNICISLNFNIDGLPLYNSSKISFWPILASIHGMYFMRLPPPSKFDDSENVSHYFFLRASTY